ncbi:MAG: DNA recombination/repair protein RecA, partial [Bilophila wadsworthia]
MAKKPTLTPEEARQEALKTALETIERKFGQGAVMKLSDDVHVKVPVIPTGSIGV